jgi:hypothetical protein
VNAPLKPLSPDEGVIAVAERKKVKKPAAIAADKKQNPAVKLTVQFHRKLKAIAAVVGLEMGELIEREMEEFIRREWQKLKQMD